MNKRALQEKRQFQLRKVPSSRGSGIHHRAFYQHLHLEGGKSQGGKGAMKNLTMAWNLISRVWADLTYKGDLRRKGEREKVRPDP